MRFWLLFFSCCFQIQSWSNDSLLIPTLFQKLLNKQQLENGFFKEGSFESYRQYANEPYFKADNNIFFTALITYNLNQLRPYLSEDEKIVTDTILNRAKKAFAYYKNKDGRWSYNFWPEKVFFPNNFILNSLSEKLALPDDLDDTGIILSSLNLPDSIAILAHKQMQEFVNGEKNKIKNTLKAYKNHAAYSTWYGKKMPIDFDFAVHCNILSFVNQYNLKWTKADSSTYQLLLSMIDEGHILNQPKFISPYYATTPILIYHLARLMSIKKMAELEERKPQLIKIALELLNQSDVFLEKIILQTSLLKFGAAENLFNLNEEDIHKYLYLNDFSFYHGHLFAHLNHTIKRIASNMSGTEFKWFSSAFNDALLLEYLILKHRKKSKSDS
ncbi:MAG: hypothetical protein KGZ59_11710 [Chitinophagaceae bacterium]|nr:hypothetical protein [Chitinophagaceae bacterium]